MQATSTTADGPVQLEGRERREGQVKVMSRPFSDLGGGQRLPFERAKDRLFNGVPGTGARTQ